MTHQTIVSGALGALILAVAASRVAAQPTPTPGPPRPPAPAPPPTPVPPTPPTSDAERARAEAQALVTEGVAALDRDPAKALDRFQRAYAVFASPKVLINTAAALRKLGRLPDASNVYQRYLDDPGADSGRRAEVQAFLAETDAKVGIVSVTGLPAGAEVQFDNTPAPWLPPADPAWLPPGTFNRWRVAPGSFKVRARKAGFVTAEQSGAVSIGASVTLPFTLVEEVTARPPPPPPDGGDGRVGVITPPPPPPDPTDDGIDDDVAPVEPARRGARLGALLELAIDGQGGGVAITPGITLRLGGRLELAAKALLGGSKGAYLGGTVYLLTGKLRPQVSVGAPLFFSSGARLGLRGAAGVCYDLADQLSVVGELGAEYFVNPEMDRVDFVLVPIVGLHARL